MFKYILRFILLSIKNIILSTIILLYILIPFGFVLIPIFFSKYLLNNDSLNFDNLYYELGFNIIQFILIISGIIYIIYIYLLEFYFIIVYLIQIFKNEVIEKIFIKETFPFNVKLILKGKFTHIRDYHLYLVMIPFIFIINFILLNNITKIYYYFKVKNNEGLKLKFTTYSIKIAKFRLIGFRFINTSLLLFIGILSFIMAMFSVFDLNFKKTALIYLRENAHYTKIHENLDLIYDEKIKFLCNYKGISYINYNKNDKEKKVEISEKIKSIILTDKDNKGLIVYVDDYGNGVDISFFRYNKDFDKAKLKPILNNAEGYCKELKDDDLESYIYSNFLLNIIGKLLGPFFIFIIFSFILIALYNISIMIIRYFINGVYNEIQLSKNNDKL